MSKFDKVFNCKSLKPFIKTMQEMLPWGGVSESIFVQCMYKNLPFLTKIYWHNKSSLELYGTPQGMHPADTEIAILRILYENVINKNYTPCIVELAEAKTCEGVLEMISREIDCSEISRTPINSDVDRLYAMYCKYAEQISHGLSYDKLSYAVMERCDWPIRYFLAKSIGSSADEAMLLSLIFQLIHAMYVLNVLYPNFRHRDLHTANVMVKVDNTFRFNHGRPQVLMLQAFGKKYYVPFFGFYVKIIDFDHSILPEEGIISNAVYDKRHVVERSDHDMLWFFYWLDFDSKNEHASPIMTVFIQSLLDSLDPNGMYYRHQENMSYINAHPELIPTYKDLLTNDVFKDYLNPGKSIIYKAYKACD